MQIRNGSFGVVVPGWQELAKRKAFNFTENHVHRFYQIIRKYLKAVTFIFAKLMFLLSESSGELVVGKG